MYVLRHTKPPTFWLSISLPVITPHRACLLWLHLTNTHLFLLGLASNDTATDSISPTLQPITDLTAPKQLRRWREPDTKAAWNCPSTQVPQIAECFLNFFPLLVWGIPCCSGIFSFLHEVTQGQGDKLHVDVAALAWSQLKGRHSHLLMAAEQQSKAKVCMGSGQQDWHGGSAGVVQPSYSFCELSTKAARAACCPVPRGELKLTSPTVLLCFTGRALSPCYLHRS